MVTVGDPRWQGVHVMDGDSIVSDVQHDDTEEESQLFTIEDILVYM